MEMRDAIVARRSVRTYTGEPLKKSLIDELMEFISGITPLHDNIPMDIELYERGDFAKDFARSFICRANDLIVIRSARNIEGYLQNVGFIGEQIILWLTHKGIGSCWVGLTKQKKPPTRGELPFVIAIQFGRSDNAPFRRLPEESPRLKLHEVLMNKISRPEFLHLLDAGRLAPSAVNLQPVRYLTINNNIYIYRKSPLWDNEKLNEIQKIDVGAAMANLYVECDGKCVFVRQRSAPVPPEKCIYEYTMIPDE